jgi:hypothetical protein
VIPAIFGASNDVSVTVLGAIVVAAFTGFLTAITTNRRLRKQLAHDRWLKDVEELRSLLDDGAICISEAMKHAADPDWLGAWTDEVSPAAYAATSGEGTDEEAFKKALNRNLHMEARIKLRLGDHEVTKAHTHARKVTGRLGELLQNKLEAAKGGKRLQEAQDRFLKRSHDCVGSRLDD